jgi:hypothetical protein
MRRTSASAFNQGGLFAFASYHRANFVLRSAPVRVKSYKNICKMNFSKLELSEPNSS